MRYAAALAWQQMVISSVVTLTAGLFVASESSILEIYVVVFLHLNSYVDSRVTLLVEKR
jgi:hypothetical protein